MKRAPVLVIPERLDDLARRLEEDYTVHRWWALDDRAAFLAGEARDVRCIVAGGASFPASSVLETFTSLGLLACISVGYEGIDIDWCRRHGVAVTIGSGANAADVAEYAVALLLTHWCRTLANDAVVRDGAWRVSSAPQRRALRGRTVGIVGMGAIGREIAARLAVFGVTIRWWGPRPNPAISHARADDLTSLAAEADILIVACRAEDENRGLIDREVIAALGPDGLLINIARGSLVDEVAVRQALTSGALGGFAADVFENEPTPPALWKGIPNALLSPHAAAATLEGRDALKDRLIENMSRFFAGRPLLDPIA